MKTKQAPRNDRNGLGKTKFNAESSLATGLGKAGGPTAHPPGSIGADSAKGEYVSYLGQRYHWLKSAETPTDGTAGRSIFAGIYRELEAAFKMPTYFLPADRFDGLLDYLHRRIDQAELGKRNLARGYRNYDSFDEHRFANGEAAKQIETNA
jgi:hypothetical protein